MLTNNMSNSSSKARQSNKSNKRHDVDSNTIIKASVNQSSEVKTTATRETKQAKAKSTKHSKSFVRDKSASSDYLDFIKLVKKGKSRHKLHDDTAILSDEMPEDRLARLEYLRGVIATENPIAFQATITLQESERVK